MAMTTRGLHRATPDCIPSHGYSGASPGGIRIEDVFAVSLEGCRLNWGISHSVHTLVLKKIPERFELNSKAVLLQNRFGLVGVVDRQDSGADCGE